MNKIIIAIAVIILLLGGGYYAYTTYMPQEAATELTPEALGQVQVQDVTAGEGAEATPGSVVSVLYVGMLEDGTVFDSSEAYGNEPLVFTLGDPNLIPGFQIGINGMRVGGERVMSVPPGLAYGEQGVTNAEGVQVIAPNATLVFNVKLLNVTSAPEETTPENAE